MALDKTIPRRDENTKIIAGGNHIEDLAADHGRESNDADVVRFPVEDVRADVLILGDFALIHASRGGRHIDSGAERANGVILGSQAPDQIFAAGRDQRFGNSGRRRLAGENPAANHACGRASQSGH